MHHTLYGVSQFNHGEIGGQRVPVKLYNPTHVTQIAALLVYTRHVEGEVGGSIRDDSNPTEVFIDCRVRELTSHAALGLHEDIVPIDETLDFPDRRYGEVIWAPKEEVDIDGDDDGRVSL